MTTTLLEINYLLIATTIKDLAIRDPLPDGIVNEFIEYVVYVPLVTAEMKKLALAVVKLDFKLNKVVERTLSYLKEKVTTIPNLSEAINRYANSASRDADKVMLDMADAADTLPSKVQYCWEIFTSSLISNIDELAAQIKTTAMIPVGRYTDQQAWKSPFYKSRIDSLTEQLNIAIKKVETREDKEFTAFQTCINADIEIIVNLAININLRPSGKR